MNHFSHKVALVTGAASGIGRGLCEALTDEGAVVYAADVDEAGLEAVTGSSTAHAIALDVTKPEDFDRALSQIVESHGRIDFVFNNAGIGVVGDFRDIEPADLERIIDVNLWGVVHGTRAAYERMVAQGHGHIVNTASPAGMMPVPMQTPYAMTKHAVVGLSRSLRIEAAVYGVKVSVVLPGLVRTDFFDAASVAGAYRYKEAMDGLPLTPISPRRAGEDILRGVRTNRELIAFPTSNRIVLWLVRHVPRVMLPLLARATVDSLRRPSES